MPVQLQDEGHIPIYNKGSFCLPKFEECENVKEKAVIKLLRASDAYMTRSKNANDMRDQYLYNAIKSLELVCLNYAALISPQLELLTYLKLALVMIELHEVEKAEKYLLNVLEITTRHNLILFSFVAEYFGGQLLHKTNPKLSPRYLQEKIMKYDKKGLCQFADLLRTLRIMTIIEDDPANALIMLNESLDNPNLDPMIRSICLIFHCNIAPHHRKHDDCKTKLDEVQSIFLNLDEVPIQLRAMYLLSKYAISVKNREQDESEVVMKELNVLISSEHGVNWTEWSECGSFNIPVRVSFNDDLLTELNCEVPWLTSNEFVITFYALTSLKLLQQNPKATAATKTLKYCMELIDNDLQFSVQQSIQSQSTLRNHISKIRDSILVYQAWDDLLKDKPSSTSKLEELVGNFNQDAMHANNPHSPRRIVGNVLFLLGVACQVKGQKKEAQYFYSLIQQGYNNLVKSNGGSFLETLSVADKDMLTHRSDDIKLLSALHLLLLHEYFNETDSELEGSRSHSFELTELYARMDTYTRGLKGQLSVENFLDRFAVTYYTSKSVLFDGKENLFLEMSQGEMEEFSKSGSGSALTTMLNYVLFHNDNDKNNLRMIYLERTMQSIKISLWQEFKKPLNVFVLRALEAELNPHTELDLLAEIRIRLEFLSKN